MPTLDPRFTPALIAMAQASHKKFYPRGPFVSINLAQWAVESAYGAHLSGINNPFGIKATWQQRDAGQAREVLTHEYIDGQWLTEEQYFANYPSLEAAFDAHATLLTTPHYQRCIDAIDPQQYALALHTCGYATAPNYPQVLMSVITANDLQQFDQRF
jgi:flagellum-specific peptidoglycan hydrolase FlgJ